MTTTKMPRGKWIATAVASLGGVLWLAGTTSAVAAKPVSGRPVKVTLNAITADGVGGKVGTVMIKPTREGVELAVEVSGLTAGEHGFHLHEKASCDPADKDGTKTAGQSAGAHWDPDMSKAHKGPGGGGHKGDLPKLTVPENGKLKAKFSVTGVMVTDFAGKSLMIHAGGDNYSDAPKPLGGGGDRVVCGVVPGDAASVPPAAPVQRAK